MINDLIDSRMLGEMKYQILNLKEVCADLGREIHRLKMEVQQQGKQIKDLEDATKEGEHEIGINIANLSKPLTIGETQDTSRRIIDEIHKGMTYDTTMDDWEIVPITVYKCPEELIGKRYELLLKDGSRAFCTEHARYWAFHPSHPQRPTHYRIIED